MTNTNNFMKRFLRSCTTSLVALTVILVVVGALFVRFAAPSGIEEMRSSNPSLQPVLPDLDNASVKWVTVRHVIDGDTIVVDNDLRVRYIGVDSPELHMDECFAQEAKEHNKLLVDAQQVGLQKDVSETDRYGRLLRYVYLTDGTMVNARLVQDGYASVASFPPDVLFIDYFLQLENQARSMSRGLWGMCES